jgi:hypothetical protein
MFATPSQNNPWPEQTPIPEPSSPRLSKRRRTLHSPPLQPRGSTSKMARQIVTDQSAIGQYRCVRLYAFSLTILQTPLRPIVKSTRAMTLSRAFPPPTPLYPSTNGQRLSVRTSSCWPASLPHRSVCRELQSSGFHSDRPCQHIPLPRRLATTNPRFSKCTKPQKTSGFHYRPG